MLEGGANCKAQGLLAFPLRVGGLLSRAPENGDRPIEAKGAFPSSFPFGTAQWKRLVLKLAMQYTMY